MTLTSLKPAVSKYWLIAMAGLMWSVVGLMLCRLAYFWLSAIPWQGSVSLATLGIISGLMAYRFGFSRIARKNIDRLCLLADKSCIFAFQAWRSYLIIIFMIMLGLSLRHSPLPKQYLAVIYITIGGALFLASFQFYRRIWRVKIQKQPCMPNQEMH
jgi:hypothetical protein